MKTFITFLISVLLITSARAANAAVATNSLIKLECPSGAAPDHPCKAVYYYGSDGKRHAFPNDKVYFTWYSDFSSVQTVSSDVMASFPLGTNVTYRPGVKMVKFTSLAKVYAVSKNGSLRWVASEAAARLLYGSNWNQKIDDVSDAFFANYTFGTDINSSSDFIPTIETATASSIDVDKGFVAAPTIQPPLPGYPTTPAGTAFFDDFISTSLNENLWEINDGFKYWDSWYTASKTSVANGTLRLRSDAGDVTTQGYLKVGGIKSRAFYSFGKFTFRAKINPAQGNVSALFLYNEDKDMEIGGRHEEIDFEMSSKFPNRISLTTYHNDDWTSADLGLQNEMHRGGIKDIRAISGLANFDSRVWNTYVIDWQPGKLIWYVNGIKVEEFTNAVPTTPMHFSLDTYNTRSWEDFIDQTPVGGGALEIDSVRYEPWTP